MIIGKFIAVIILGYLLGSLPFGLWIGRRNAKVDVRHYGSGKTGATNVLRAAGKKMAAIVVSLDVLKGALAVVFAGLILGEDYLVVGGLSLGVPVAQVLAGLAAIIGHIWSVFLKFQGGRGVATFAGGIIALCPIAAVFGGGVLLIVICLTRYVSLGSIVGLVGIYTILVPLTIMNGLPIEYLFYALVGTVLIIVMHRDNIVRLVSGTERKLGEKAESRGSPSSSRRGRDFLTRETGGTG
ncbi:glycerol-3-phosphate 1-O-acyltransferase PlsY [Chloroflexota bacterium]